MPIDKEIVKYIGNLARIELDEGELDYYAAQLKKIINYIEKINELKLEEIPPTFNPHASINVWRKDEICRFKDIRSLHTIVPEVEGRFIKIPKVIE